MLIPCARYIKLSRGLHQLLYQQQRRGISKLYKNKHDAPSLSVIVPFIEKLRSSGQGEVKLIESEHDDRVLELHMLNEKSRNALTGKMMMELHDVVHNLAGGHDTEPRWKKYCALIVIGGGHTFCAGADLKLARDVIRTPEDGALMSEIMTTTLMRLRRLPLISVAAIDGAAVGGGAELATACDFRVMTPRSKVRFVQAEMGVSTGWGGTARLVKIIGRQKALELLGTTKVMQSAAAIENGFCDGVTETNDALVGSYSFLAPYLRHRAESLRAIKYSIAAADDLPFHEAREVETSAFKLVWGSPAMQHAVEAAVQALQNKKKT